MNNFVSKLDQVVEIVEEVTSYAVAFYKFWRVDVGWLIGAWLRIHNDFVLDNQRLESGQQDRQGCPSVFRTIPPWTACRVAFGMAEQQVCEVKIILRTARRPSTKSGSEALASILCSRSRHLLKDSEYPAQSPRQHSTGIMFFGELAAMSILETAKDVITLVQKADNLELVKQVLALQSDIMKMMDENRALKDENRALREELHVKQKLVFRNNAYWLPNEGGSEEGPFCATCRDGDNKLVRMSQSATLGSFLCRVCLLKQKRK
jgi:hypothetical protein